MSAIAVLFVLVIGAGVGFLIGRAKQRPLLGLLLGLILNWLGWIVMAFVPRRGRLTAETESAYRAPPTFLPPPPTSPPPPPPPP
jgi:hypothetical protein